MEQNNQYLISKIPTTFKAYLLSQIKALKKGIDKLDFWYLKMLQPKIPFLNLLQDSQLERLGRIIVANLPNIKTYNGIVKILRAVYGNNSTAIFIKSEKPGILNIDIEGEIGERDSLILKNNDNLVLNDGNKLVLRGYGIISSYNYNDFFLNFILAGVHLKSITINEQKVTKIVSYKNDILVQNKQNVLIQTENGVIKNG